MGCGMELFSRFMAVSTDTSNKKLSPLEILQLHGNIEVEVCEGSEANLHDHMKNCNKNPGHGQFIPIRNFKVENLPEGHQDMDLYDLIKATADLTVRICVQMTSPHRPEFWPGTNVPYPFYGTENNEDIRTGSGNIGVYKFVDGHGYNGHGQRCDIVTGRDIERDYITCPCDKCLLSDKPSNVWWEIYMHTATHVVFDEIEAKHTTCRLFYDCDGQGSPVMKLENVNVDYVDIEEDMCRLKHVTCEDLGKILYEMKVRQCDLRRKARNKYKDNLDIIFLVSHPHGCSKHVSVGRLVDNYKVREVNDEYDLTKLTYTTGTCPGSSGAKVHYVGSVVGHIHTGCLGSGLNYSCVSYFYRK